MESQHVETQVDRAAARLGEIQRAVGQIVVGQERLVESLLVALLCRGHVLLEGVPGLAKTLTVRTLAGVVGGSFQRLQFTPDMLPSDVTGTQIFDPKTATFIPHRGPVFANLVLADEINRAPPKVQSALLEAMQERQVTIGDETFKLDDPFLVLATQNPIEQEGTYPLPEAQTDRFLLKLRVGYPTKEEEKLIVDRMTTGTEPKASPAVEPKAILRGRDLCTRIYVDDKLKDYILNIVFATRQPKEHNLADLEPLLRYGASPRASIYLLTAARAMAFLRRRGFVIPEDIKELAPDVLRHRIILSYEAEAEELTTDDVVKRVLEGVEVP
jgi:MoxR-like ATPase